MTLPTYMPNEYSGTEQGIQRLGIQTLATQQDVTPMNPVGCVTRLNGKLYRYVYLDSGTTVAGAPAYFETTTDPSLGLFKVTATNGASGQDNSFAGVFLASGLTTSRFIWVQVGGINEALVCQSGAVVGDSLAAAASDTFTLLASGVSGINVPVINVTVAENGSNVAGGIVLGPFGW